MKPEDLLFGKHGIDEIASNAFKAESERERLIGLQLALRSPDSVESIDVGGLSDYDASLTKLENILRIRSLSMSDSDNLRSRIARAENFEPYEQVVSDEHFSTEFATSLIAIDLHEKLKTNGVSNPIGKIVLLKLDYSNKKITTKDLKIGVNCIYGAIIINDTIKPFRLSMNANGDKVLQELQRPDTTDEEGMVVEARVVEKGDDRQQLNFYELDPNKDAEEYLGVMSELDKFIVSRNKNAQEPNA